MKIFLLGGLPSWRVSSLVLAGRPSKDLLFLIKTRRPERSCSESSIARFTASAVLKSTYAKPLLCWGFPNRGGATLFADFLSSGPGMWTRVIASSVRSEYSTRNLRRSSLDTLQGRLPIHTPCSDRFSTSAFFFFCSSGSGVVSAPDLEGGRVLPFLRRRRSFLEGGSGAVMSTSISSIKEVLRFFESGSVVDSSMGGMDDSGGFSSVASVTSPLIVRVEAFLFLLDLSSFVLEDDSGVAAFVGEVDVAAIDSLTSPFMGRVKDFDFLLDLSLFGLEEDGGEDVVCVSTFAVLCGLMM